MASQDPSVVTRSHPRFRSGRQSRHQEDEDELKTPMVKARLFGSLLPKVGKHMNGFVEFVAGGAGTSTWLGKI